jgi:hypothetical protein
VNEKALTLEEYLGSRSAQRLLISEVTTIASLLSNTPEPEDDKEVAEIDCVIREPRVSVALFDYLIESGRLPETDGAKGRIVYGLTSNKLVVNIVPSACHDYAAGSFTTDLMLWAASCGVLDSLDLGLGSCTLSIHLFLT